MTKKYFFESDDGFVKLSWEDVRKVYQDVAAVAIDRDGKIFAYDKVAQKSISYCDMWDSVGNNIYLGQLAKYCNDWESLIFYPPPQITDEIKAAIKLLFPDAKYLAMDMSGKAYVHMDKPGIDRVDHSVWIVRGDVAFDDFRVPALDNYSNDWENSLIKL